MRPRNPYLVLDVETGIEPNEVSGVGGKANPYAGVPLVMVGYKATWLEEAVTVYWDGPGTRPALDGLLAALAGLPVTDPLIIVGHNLNFDLHHVFLEHTTEEVMALLGNVTMWDTASAEYYLTGQRVKTPPLVDLETKYLKTERSVAKDEMHDLFKAGIGSDKIDRETLDAYLRDDLSQTVGVFFEQLTIARDQGQLGFLRDMMDSQLLAFIMEKEGVPVDVAAVPTIIADAQAAFEAAQAQALQAMGVLYPLQGSYVPNPGSPVQVSNALTGRQTRYVAKVPMTWTDDVGVDQPLLFKSGAKKGQPRFKNVDCLVTPDPFPFDVLESQGKEPNQQAGTGEKQLKALLSELTDPLWVGFIDALLAWRDADKTYNTYAKGYLSKVCPDGQLRTSINQTVTPTSRVSSSNVNLQNIPGSD